jgi:hypothetical protein
VLRDAFRRAGEALSRRRHGGPAWARS